MSAIQLLSQAQEDLLEIRFGGFRKFVRLAWPILEPATPFIDGWHIDCMADHLQAVSEGQLKHLIINVPPGSSKSLVTSVMWPAYHWTRFPQDRFLTASYTDVLSLRDALKSRRLIQSAWYQEIWGNLFRMTGDQNAKGRYENDKTGYRIATHVGGGTGERAKYRILDDPHNIDEAESDTIREGAVTWVRTTWADRESDTKTGGDVVVMQRLHERDVSGMLLNEIGGYTHVMIPMRFEAQRRFVTVVKRPEGGTWQDPRTVEGELLCPARWDAEDVALKEKRLGSYATAGQLQQRPSPELGGILKRHWFRYWQHPGDTYPPVKVKLPSGEHEDIKPVDLPWAFDRALESWDMTFKGSTGTDYVVGQKWGKKGADAYLIDQSRDRRDFPETLAEVRRFHAEHKRYPGQIIIEDKANGPAIISTLKREIPGIIPHPGNDDKVARAHAHAYLVESGNVYLPHPKIASWVETFIAECCVYDNGAHDDQVIAWSQAMDELYKVEDSGVAITPQYSARFHQSPTSLEPIQGLPSFRFWFQGLYPCCVMGQTLSSGRIMLIDCLLGDQNQSLEDLIDRKVTPTLAADYRGCTEWRDITNHGPMSQKSDVSEHHMDSIIRSKLNGNPEPGEPDFFTRLNAITTLLSQTDRLYVNPAPSPGEAKPWIHEALKGGYAYRKDQAGVISKTEPRKFHPLSSVGDAIGHGLCKIFMRKALPSPKFNKADGQRRAKSYAV